MIRYNGLDTQILRTHVLSEAFPVHFDLWDCPGENGSMKCHRAYIEESDAAILVFDLQKPPTLDSIRGWYGGLPNWAPWIIAKL